jgi:hypothetical protein
MVTKLVNSGMVGTNVATDMLSVVVGSMGGTPTFTLAAPHEELAILGLLPFGNTVGLHDLGAVTIGGDGRSRLPRGTDIVLTATVADIAVSSIVSTFWVACWLQIVQGRCVSPT